MSVKDTIYACLIKYPTLYENKWQVYHHLFSSYGNGYDWVDGELVEMIIAKKGKDENGEPKIFKPTLSRLGIKRKEIPERVKLESEDFTPIFYTWIPFRLPELRKKWAERSYEHYCYLMEVLNKPSLSYEDYVIQEVHKEPKKQSILRHNETERDYLIKTQSIHYSYVYHYPLDIKPDWAEARQEWEDYLREMNCYLKQD